MGASPTGSGAEEQGGERGDEIEALFEGPGNSSPAEIESTGSLNAPHRGGVWPKHIATPSRTSGVEGGNRRTAAGPPRSKGGRASYIAAAAPPPQERGGRGRVELARDRQGGDVLRAEVETQARD